MSVLILLIKDIVKMEISKEQRSKLLSELIDFFQLKYGRLNFADRLRLVDCFDFILKRIGEEYGN